MAYDRFSEDFPAWKSRSEQDRIAAGDYPRESKTSRARWLTVGVGGNLFVENELPRLVAEWRQFKTVGFAYRIAEWRKCNMLPRVAKGLSMIIAVQIAHIISLSKEYRKVVLEGKSGERDPKTRQFLPIVPFPFFFHRVDDEIDSNTAMVQIY